MAKGLSDTQMKILVALNDYTKQSTNNSIKLYNDFFNLVKPVLYPDLYGKSFLNHKDNLAAKTIQVLGQNSYQKNVARVVISKSLKRLIDRGLIEIYTRPGYFGGFVSYLRLTPNGLLTVNVLQGG